LGFGTAALLLLAGSVRPQESVKRRC